jgi:hypothetical protein
MKLSEEHIKPKKALAREIILQQLSEECKNDINELRRWMEHKRYSESTINTYTIMLGYFLRFIHPKQHIKAKNQ